MSEKVKLFNNYLGYDKDLNTILLKTEYSKQEFSKFNFKDVKEVLDVARKFNIPLGELEFVYDNQYSNEEVMEYVQEIADEEQIKYVKKLLEIGVPNNVIINYFEENGKINVKQTTLKSLAREYALQIYDFDEFSVVTPLDVYRVLVKNNYYEVKFNDVPYVLY